MRSYVYATYISLESVNLSRSRGKSRNNSVHRYVQSIFFFFLKTLSYRLLTVLTFGKIRSRRIQTSSLRKYVAIKYSESFFLKGIKIFFHSSKNLR